MAFRATDAAVEGFRLIRREPMTVAGWALAFLVMVAGMYGLMFAMGVPNMTMPGPGTPPEQTLAMIGPIMGFAGVALIFGVLIYAVITCAIYRAVLRPQETGFARLRLGADEGRMALLFIVLYLLMVAFFTVIIVAAVGIGVVAGVGAGRDAGAGAIGLAILGGFVLVLVIIAAVIWFAIKFSLAGAMTFADRRLHVFSAWKLTKGHFWSLLGCFFLSWIIAVAISMVSGALQFIPLAIFGGEASPFQAMMNPSATPSMASYFTPGYIAAQCIAAVANAIIYPIMLAPAAAAYRDIVGLSAPNQADVFA